MSVAIKMLFVLLGWHKQEPQKKLKKNATKFSKGLKQSISQDARELADKINSK